jgi:cytochrome P450
MAEAHIIMATLLRRYRLVRTDSLPVLPVSRVTIEPSFTPMFRLVLV